MPVSQDKWLTTWELETGSFEQKVKSLATKIRESKKYEKELALVRETLARKTDALGNATAKATRKTRQSTRAINAMSVATGNIAAVAVGKLTMGIKSTVKTMMDYEDWIGRDTGAIERLSEATGGLVSHLDIARARTRLTTGDFQLSEKQIEAVIKSAVAMTRIYKTDFPTSLSKVTDAITAGTTRGLRPLGINIDLVGTATQKTDQALQAVVKRFEGTTVKAKNTNEALSQLGNEWQRFVGQLGTDILKGGKIQMALESVTDSFRWWTEYLGIASSKLERLHAMSIKMGKVRMGYWGIEDPEKARKAMLSTMDRDMEAIIKEGPRNIRGKLKGKERKTTSTGGPQIGAGLDESSYTGHRQLAQMEREIEIRDRLRELAVFEREAQQAGMAEDPAIKKYRAKSLELEQKEKDIELTEFLDKRQQQLLETSRLMTGAFMETTGSLANYAGGIWQAADAAIQGGESFSKAMGRMLKSTMLSIAAEATVKGMMALAGYAASLFTAVPLLKAAGIYFATAAVAGSIGLGMSAGGVGASRSKSTAARSGRGAGTGTERYRTTPQQRKQEDREVIVNVYMGDQHDPTVAKYVTKQVSYQMQQGR